MGRHLERDRVTAGVPATRSMCLMRPTYHRVRARHRGLLRRSARLLALATAATIAVALAPGTAAASTLIVEGAGEGHGVGMSQDGALGLARHGWTYEQILGHYYTATTLGQAPPRKVIRVLVGSRVLRVPLERYVRGVVAAEMPSSWPAAALQAQAVASRTYALTAHAGGARFDVFSDTRSQVYRGRAAETAASNAAVAATAGQIVLYAGRPAATYFFASSGGVTESIQNSFLGAAAEPWLVGVADPYDRAVAPPWKLSLGFTETAARLRGVLKGAFRGIEVLTRGVSPRIVSARVLGARGSAPISGPELAARLGLRSAWAYFSVRIRSRIRREPDHSGQAPPGGSPGVPAPPPGVGGGAPAPASAAEVAVTGGASAG
jgi:stage II sporulation protein D